MFDCEAKRVTHWYFESDGKGGNKYKEEGERRRVEKCGYERDTVGTYCCEECWENLWRVDEEEGEEGEGNVRKEV